MEIGVFLEGNRLFKIPLFTRAAEKYIAAIEKWTHPALYFNLALTQLNLGQDLTGQYPPELATLSLERLMQGIAEGANKNSTDRLEARLIMRNSA